MKKPTTAVHLFRKRADNLHFNEFSALYERFQKQNNCLKRNVCTDIEMEIFLSVLIALVLWLSSTHFKYIFLVYEDTENIKSTYSRA